MVRVLKIFTDTPPVFGAYNTHIQLVFDFIVLHSGRIRDIMYGVRSLSVFDTFQHRFPPVNTRSSPHHRADHRRRVRSLTAAQRTQDKKVFNNEFTYVLSAT